MLQSLYTYMKVFLESCFPSNEKGHKEDMVFGFGGIDNKCGELIQKTKRKKKV